jgi:hypothetical protein
MWFDIPNPWLGLGYVWYSIWSIQQEPSLVVSATTLFIIIILFFKKEHAMRTLCWSHEPTMFSGVCLVAQGRQLAMKRL